MKIRLRLQSREAQDLIIAKTESASIDIQSTCPGRSESAASQQLIGSPYDSILYSECKSLAQDIVNQLANAGGKHVK